ncbi:hypothetical protein B0A49_04481 [Cryomyces minteri]|uniref:mannan endo-1,4-beta-mannosidase n=1 Tax=Cryomyces minteri TaxID=331657 RepID=A0A4U0WWA3_9PEZI|nr:hypothetical protein B0A49_04481 [Cryomyces minteri]
MLFSLFALLCAAGFATAAPKRQHAYVDGRLFNIDSKTQYFAGTNTWWLGRLNDADINTVVSQLAETKLLVTRVWGFGNVNDDAAAAGSVYYQVLNSTGGYINYDYDTGIGRLDSVVKAAEKYAAYRNYIKFIVNRYKHSPAIFAWELMNEPRCRGCPTSTIYDWASSTSQFIKSLDSSHMVTLGDEGWVVPSDGYGDGSYAYSGLEGVDFVKNLGISTLDFGTFHLASRRTYPTSWGSNASFGIDWIAQHDAAGAAANKPVIAEEYGWPTHNNRTAIEASWQQYVLKSTHLAADMFWQFADSMPAVSNEVDEYAVFYNTTKGSDYDVLAIQHARAMLEKRTR